MINVVEIYTKKTNGGFEGYETDASAWNLYQETYFNVTKNGATAEIGRFEVPLYVANKEIQAFFIVFPYGGTIVTANDGTRDPVSNSNMIIYTGKGVNNILNQNPFTANLQNNRIFIGVVQYNDASCNENVDVKGMHIYCIY